MLAALHLLHYLGFSTVYLLGADFKMGADQKYAFAENRSPQSIRHNNVLYDSLRQRFKALRPHFEKHGFTVLNATPGSELEAFDRIAFADAVARAGSECGKPVSTQGWYELNKEAKK
jgi:hypothetical protein